jgi:acetyl-CoA synthetase
VIGRVDDVINVSGHRLSTAEVESAIVSHANVAEAAVIGQADEHTGQSICAFVTLEGEIEGTEELEGDIREHVAGRIGKFARPKRIVWADDLPKTRSGKIMRRLLRDIAEGHELGDVTTLRDPDVVEQLDEVVKRRAKEGDEE